MYDRIFLKFISPCFIIKVVSRTVRALLPVKNCCEEILNLSLQLHKFPWKRSIVNCCVKSLRSNDAAPSNVIVVSLGSSKTSVIGMGTVFVTLNIQVSILLLSLQFSWYV